MTDIEPRRSGRKTKGQHTRNSEVHELPPPPVAKSTPSRRKSSAPKQPTPAASSPAVSTPEPGSDDEEDEDDDPNAQIRCACGATQEVKGDTRMMVQCEGCKVWQHCECLELDEDELEEDKDYYCEVCKPENHEEFLAKVERGEKPWETAKKNRRRRKGRKSTGKGRKGKASQAKKKSGKKEEPEAEAETEEAPPLEVEPEIQPEIEMETKVDAEVDVEADAEAKPNAGHIEEPQPEVTEEEKGVEEEPVAKVEETVEETKEGVGVGVGEEDKAEKINGTRDEVDEADEAKDVENTEQEAQPVQQVTTEEKVDEEDVKMGEAEQTEIEKPKEKTPQVETAAAPMAPPEAAQPPLDVPQDGAAKEDEEMVDAPEKTTPPPITPTTPIATRQRESKRKGSMPEPQRALRRKTTHDSDGDYQSDGDMPQQHHRRASASSATKQELTKETPVKPPPRRPSVPKPPPKKPSGPDDLSIQSEAVEKVDDLRNNARRNIVNFLAPIIEKVVQQNEEILSQEQKQENYPEKLALEIEYHLYLALWNQHSQPTQQYKLKARGIGLNLPKNPVLQSRLLKGEVTPETLVQMKPEEMASEEFQLMAEQVRRESEFQNTILAEETGPRIRRTHKGEEIVEDDINRPTGSDEPIYSGGGGGGGGSDHVMEEAPTPRSRAVSQAAEDYPMSPPHMNTEESMHSSHVESAPQTPRTPHSARTPTATRGRQFSIEGVWNNVNAPEGPTHPKTPGARHPQHMLSLRTTTQPKTEVDAEIDKLLAEEDHDMDNETPPYSPSELTFTDTALPVWRGRVSMVNVSNFPARAHFLGGPEDAPQFPLNELLGGSMLIDGRIGIDRATEYLCGQKWSKTNDVIVLSIEPEDHMEPAAAGEFNKLFQYFQKKERYGVVGKPALPGIKDCYLVPIDMRDDMPDFFETLPKHLLEPAPRKRRVFAVVFVLSKTTLVDAEKKLKAGKSRSTSEPQKSPMTRTPVQQQTEVLHHHNHQQHFLPAQALPSYPAQAHPSFQQPQYQQPYGQPQQHPYVTPPPINHHAHGNGYHHSYYQSQPQQQPMALPLHHQHQSPPPPPPQQMQHVPPPPSQLAQQPPVKKFHFTPWKELQDALPQLTMDQVNVINSIVARNPAAQQDPGLLARLIKEHGGM